MSLLSNTAKIEYLKNKHTYFSLRKKIQFASVSHISVGSHQLIMMIFTFSEVSRISD